MMDTSARCVNRKKFLKMGGNAVCMLALGTTISRFSNAFAQSGSENYVRPAMMWKKLAKNAVECSLCPNGCVIENGERGQCRVRKNIKGSLYTLVYSRIAAAHVDPIEKKPMYHFLPGSTAFSIATAGCNLSCKFCQNWELSQSRPEDLDATEITPEDLSRKTISSGSKIIAYTYNEPTVQFEYIIDSARHARKKGIRSIIISNGYIRPEAGRIMAESLDAVKIDLKAFTENFYSSVCGGSLRAVLDNLVSVHSTGRWLEIVILIIPTLNDSQDEIHKMCAWVCKNLSRNVPMHFTRFHAMYRIRNLPPTPISTLEHCYAIAKDAGIRYPYIGNVSGHKWENTYCHNCDKMLIRRSGYFHVENQIKNGTCKYCSAKIPGIWS